MLDRQAMNPSPRDFLPRSTQHRLGLLVSASSLAAALALSSACSSSNNPAPASAISSERKDAVERLDTSTRLLSDLRGEVPDAVAREARCVVVVPALVQGGLVVGGRGGRGFADCLKKGAEWGQPAPISVSGASFGAQIGVETIDVLMLVMNDEAKAALLDGHFRIGVDASAAAGPVGTEASKDFKVGSGILSYARSKGLFAGATLGDALVARDDDATQALYGGVPELRSLLQGPMSSPGPSADRFVAALRAGFGPNAHVAAAPGPDLPGGVGSASR
jgi:lipid-binding SYLF domain-containing protein